VHSALAGFRRWPIAVVALLALGVASVASLAAVSGGSTIAACVKKKGGSIRIVRGSTKCRRNERLLTWNTIGPAGPRGLRGFNGTRGPTGATGAAGAAGAAGSNAAVNGFVDANPAGSGSYFPLPTSASPLVIATLKLAAGHYLVQGDVHLEQTLAAGSKVTCSLDGNEETLDEGVIDVGSTAPGQVKHGDLALGGGLTLTAAGMAFISCTPETGGNAAAGAKITAAQVTTLTSTTG
jgi:hypothetical protein